MDAERSSPEHPDPWATGRRRPGRPDRGRRPAAPTGTSGTASSGTASSGTASSGTASPGTASPGTASPDTAAPGTAAPAEPPGRALERRPAPAGRDDPPRTVDGSVAGPPRDRPAPEEPVEDPWRHWRRLRPRSVRGATALGLAGTALFLFPFLDEPGRWWVPAGLGFGTLVLLALLRLDRLLFGWAPHVAGVVLIAALVYGTARNPWAWGMALATGVVVAGLLLLPRWKVLAVGGVLLVLAGIGYTFRSAEIQQDQARVDAQAGAQFRAELGVERPQLALVTLDTGVVDGNPARVCRVAQEPAVAQLRAATGAATCEDAVAVLHSRLPAGAEPTRPDRKSEPDVPPGGTTTVDACASAWGAAAPQLGRVELTRTGAARPTFQVSSFAPC
ncbi:hypothetical protein AD006_06190 [Pseudonocardia sp. EC080610-09]|uniref:hypothetical protein n=1 Tax=unclassified Pseudonocardia TaxID=2619320 RepID=UPI000706D7DB|nr:MULTISPECIES: hypothetical protein [unclassified Pseudonocardia]ALL75001.1 hypothetical protein AD006_06190 [Pseudonocardia sp. EC080610-09]ALL82023.1 hypothetical protein AD017_14010 [Pseudonocardia sp. EC080619-01]